LRAYSDADKSTPRIQNTGRPGSFGFMMNTSSCTRCSLTVYLSS
jgi:hypothetical protein